MIDRGLGARHDILVDENAIDVFEVGKIVHRIDQKLFERRPKTACARLAGDRLLGDRRERARGNIETNALDLEHLLILAHERVLGLGEEEDPNEPGWHIGEWNDWSSTCATPANRRRVVFCEQDGEQVSAGMCYDAGLGPAPSTMEKQDVVEGCDFGVHGTFEESFPVRWGVYNGATRELVGDSHSGNAALSVSGGVGVYHRFAQPLPAGLYEIRGWAKLPEGQDSTNSSCMARQPELYVSQEYRANFAKCPTEWTEVSLQFRTAGGLAQFHINVNYGEMLIDDVTMTRLGG